MLRVIRYSPERQEEWNQFILRSKNGTFLFDRNYMDYHADRFADFSLMIYNEKGKLIAVLPANVSGTKDDGRTLYSHQGLTYGGLIVDCKTTISTTQDIFSAITNYLKEEKIYKVIYKAIPWIYHKLPAEEDLYVLFNNLNARLTCREISSTIIIPSRPALTELRRRGVRKAIKAGITIAETDDVEGFWNILNNNLVNRYNTTPVHTSQELKLLMGRFPDEIRLWGAFLGTRMLGGIIIYKTPQVVHTQYIAATDEGKKLGAIDRLTEYLLNDAYNKELYFDFGKSTEENGRYLNMNLIHQKQGFGGRAVCYDTYEWEIKN